MSTYFTKFPVAQYRLDDDPNSNPTFFRNFFFRLKLQENLKNNAVIYYDYSIKDGDTPHSVADKYYNDSEKHWIILLTNSIIDPIFDWPLPYEAFTNYMNKKYAYLGDGNGIDLAKENIHHYIMTINTEDSATGTITIKNYTIDLNLYSNTAQHTFQEVDLPDGSTVAITTTTDQVTIYDYENDLNESKRNIRLIDKSYMSQIQSEFDRLVRT